jgi:hypothetical protein
MQKNIWTKLGLLGKIKEAMLTDRSGNAVLEELIMKMFDDDVRELILPTAWYIW